MTAKTVTASTINTVRGETSFLWETLDGDDVGSVVRVPEGTTAMCVQLGGAGGNTAGGATTIFQGSNDEIAETTPASAVWFTLTEKYTASTAISRTTTEVLKEVKEICKFVRPNQSAGSGGDMDVILVCKHPG